MSIYDVADLRKAQKTSLLTLLGGLFLITSCSTVSLKQNLPLQNIEKQRGNIVTRNELSDNTRSTLLSAGIDDVACLQQFEICLNQLNKNVLNKNNKQSFALLAELHLAKARSLKEIEICNEELLRPPIDPYYANAPLPEKEKKALEDKIKQCQINYRNHLLEAIKTSYAYLFYDRLKANKSKVVGSTAPKAKYLPTDSDIQTQDIYEFSADALIKLLYSEQIKKDKSIHISLFSEALSTSNKANKHSNTAVNNNSNIVKLLNFKIDNNYKNINNKNSTSIDLFIPNEPEYISTMKQVDHNVSEIYASHDLNFSGLNFISQREGFGISYVTLLNDRTTTSVRNLIKSGGRELNVKDPVKRIHRTGNLILSAVVIPKGNTIEQVLNTDSLNIELYNPHHTNTINILGNPYYLTGNFSASYGVWLSENNLDNVGYFSMLSKQQSLILPQLFMLEPYNPNKHIIIMLHGLASSPVTWVRVTNDIFNDETLRNNYQVWQVFYPTNIPILENRYQIQKLIETAYQINDPQGQHPASKHSVLIGHSMGAVISRMMLADANLETKIQTMDKVEQHRRLNNLINKQLDEQNIRDRLQLHPLSNVDRAVFMSAPFRGTDYADQWFTLALRRIIELPLGFVQTIKGNLTSMVSEGELTANPLGALYFENGASQLSDKSSFMALTSDLKIHDGVTYHSIIANQDDDITRGLAQLQSLSDAQLDLSKKQVISADVNSSQPSSSLSKTQESNDPMAVPMIASVNISTELSQTLSESLSDGIVPYESSHLEGAASETIISGTHSIQASPQAVITLRKILHEQLKEHPVEPH